VYEEETKREFIGDVKYLEAFPSYTQLFEFITLLYVFHLHFNTILP